MTGETAHRRKLIEVALPLDEINAACKADKDRKTGTIRNLHKWFAPMPLPAWRALIFAALVDDPDDDERRAYLLDVIKRLVANGADLPDEDVLVEAGRIIEHQFPDGVPPVMDPFCGGGTTLVEAQRLGLPTFGSDLNPVPVLITKTLTELLPKVFGQQPLHPESSHPAAPRDRRSKSSGQGALDWPSGPARQYTAYDGLLRDVYFYAEQIRDEAWLILSDLYPSQPGETPIAWLWARTATCSNPACGAKTVLATSWWLSKKKGDLAWLEPHVDGGKIAFTIVDGQTSGEAPTAPKVGRGASFICLVCHEVIPDTAIAAQGLGHGLGLRMLAVVVEKEGTRKYRLPTTEEVAVTEALTKPEIADISLGPANQYIAPPRFGLMSQADLYTARQLKTLVVFSDLVADATAKVIAEGGSPEWASAVTALLGLAVGRRARYGSSQSQWLLRTVAHSQAKSVFARNDLPMMWDFAETFFMSGSVGDWLDSVASAARAITYAPHGRGTVEKVDARTARMPSPGLVATDPPYFDAIGYADLSDYFYLWHRRALKHAFPDLYTTMATPKSGELTAFPWHHDDSREEARTYFIEGFTETFLNLQKSLGTNLPLCVVYASKEQKGGTEEETRWSSILTAVVNSNLVITGTWPIHGTGSSRMRGIGANAVATYVVMVCRPRGETAGVCSLADFNRALRRELKSAVHDLQAAGILPVDLAQAAMGPGMQIYSRYREVVDQSGQRVPVEQALRLINSALGEVLDEQEGELDPDSRFAVAWWEKYGWEPASFGEADQLARPQGISVDDVIRAGVAKYPKAGFVGLVGNEDMNRDWRPSNDARPTAWEAVHHLADRLIDGGGVMEAGRLMSDLGLLRDPAQALVYRLHAIAARKGWSKDQERYNALIGSWSDCLAIAATEKDGLF